MKAKRIAWRNAWGCSVAVHVMLGLILGVTLLWWNPPAMKPVPAMNVHIGSAGGGSNTGGTSSQLGQQGGKSQGAFQNTDYVSLAEHALEEALSDAVAEAMLATSTASMRKIQDDASPAGGGQHESSGSDTGNELSGNGDAGNGGTDSGGGGGDPLAGSGLSRNADGTYTAHSLDGLEYTIIREMVPRYPERAHEANYTRPVVVQVGFTVGLDGQVESAWIINSPPNLGFREEALEAIYQWQFSPITYQGHPVKVEVQKDFRFTP